ncbi:bifunctional 4-hydroxy-2-oxoglutarate aldolase/2-dehydro-3-deoxy-phosphogluconate aldolase [Microcella sp.]|uniref:bifunctional 4-hydroxy-2-oxoglutarate aldolase/2-dehydro-3-deoxy-phosphogluconate aldolase n=1 Tax=Microcella sp. TaxID=1913979 RepID=UPI003F6EA06B
MSTLTAALNAVPILAILRGLTETDANDVGAALFDAGITAIEVPLNRPGALDAVRRLVTIAPRDTAVGVGTLSDPKHIPSIVAAGATFAVSPHLDRDLLAQCQRAGLETVPGVMTPSEMYAAYSAGQRTVKLFPYDALPASGIAGMLSVAPSDLSFMAVGGVDGDNAARILASGLSTVGVGSWLYRPGDTPREVRAKADALVTAVRRQEGSP